MDVDTTDSDIGIHFDPGSVHFATVGVVGIMGIILGRLSASK
jgi:hypothetical protein